MKPNKSFKNKQINRNVRQDKGAPIPGRIYSRQPAPHKSNMRSRKTVTKSSRIQKHSTKRRTVHVTLWVMPECKAELQRMAGAEGLSLSRFAGALLGEAIHQKLHIQHAVLLQPIIEQTIAREMRTISTRLAWLLVRVAYDGGQTRSLVANILGRQPGMTPDLLKTILKGSGKTARANITRRTPQIVALIEAVEQWLVAGEGDGQGSSGEGHS